MPLFGPKHKPPAEVVKVVKEAISVLGQVDNKDEKKTSKVCVDRDVILYENDLTFLRFWFLLYHCNR